MTPYVLDDTYDSSSNVDHNAFNPPPDLSEREKCPTYSRNKWKKKKVCDRISYPETSFESLADYIQCDWVDARVEGCHVDAKVVQDEKNTEKGGYMLDIH